MFAANVEPRTATAAKPAKATKPRIEVLFLRAVVFVDDMADTLGTMKKAADLLIEKGAISVIGVATHGVLSGKAMENLSSSQMSNFLVSDSISSSLDKEKNQFTSLDPTIHCKLKVVSSAKLIAKSISAISQKKSINEINLI